MRVFLITLGFVLLCAVDGKAQTFSIKGLIKDQDTQETIPSVHVYLNGTSIGVLSKTDGSFILDNIPEGTYELSFSFVGYTTETFLIDTSELQEFYEVFLKPSVIELEELVITPKKYGRIWEENMKVFLKNFIGTSSRARQVDITNPKVLNFYYDYERKLFEAWAYEPLIIKNDALGYQVDYYLEEFSIDYNTNQVIVLGTPAFKPLKSRRKRTNERWEKNRKEAYLGSIDHFFQCLMDDDLMGCGYELRAEQRTETERRVSSQLAQASDVLQNIDDGTFELRFYNYMNVVYLNEPETQEFIIWDATSLSEQLRAIRDNQRSVLTLNNEEKAVILKRNGYVNNPRTLLKGGYWAFEKIADLLPLDYRYSEEPSPKTVEKN